MKKRHSLPITLSVYWLAGSVIERIRISDLAVESVGHMAVQGSVCMGLQPEIAHSPQLPGCPSVKSRAGDQDNEVRWLGDMRASQLTALQLFRGWVLGRAHAPLNYYLLLGRNLHHPLIYIYIFILIYLCSYIFMFIYIYVYTFIHNEPIKVY